MSAIIAALADPAAYAGGKFIDFWLGPIGFGITISGFVIAAKRLKLVQSEANAAVLAIENFKKNAARYNAAGDVSSAKLGLTVARKFLDSGNWEDVAEILNNIRYSMLRLEKSVKPLDGKTSRDTKKIAGKMELAVAAIDDGLTNPHLLPSAGDIKSLIRSSFLLLHEIEQKFQEHAA